MKIIDKDEKLNTEKVLLLLNSVDYYSPISVNLNYKINFWAYAPEQVRCHEHEIPEIFSIET